MSPQYRIVRHAAFVGLSCFAALGTAQSDEPAAVPVPAVSTPDGKPTEHEKLPAAGKGGIGGNVPSQDAANRIRVISFQSPQDRRIVESLEKIVTIEFPTTALKDALDFLSHEHQFPILLDRKSLSTESLSGSEEVNLVIGGISLKQAFRLMLNSMDAPPLDYYVENGVLTVTTKATADRKLFTRIYDVSGLNITRKNDFLTTIQIGSGGTWGPLAPGFFDFPQEGFGGGFGSGKPDSEAKRPPQSLVDGNVAIIDGSLVVRQTQAVQEEVESLLNALLTLQNQSHDDFRPVRPANIPNSQGTGYF